jgi:hypothetical protein
VNQFDLRTVQFNLSGIGCWLTLIGLVWLLGAVGLGWLVKSVALLLLLLFLTPILAFLGFRFWLQRNLTRANCPVCETPLTGLRGTAIACPNCGTSLEVLEAAFERVAEAGTIDVTAVDVVDVTVESVADLPPADLGDNS